MLFSFLPPMNTGASTLWVRRSVGSLILIPAKRAFTKKCSHVLILGPFLITSDLTFIPYKPTIMTSRSVHWGVVQLVTLIIKCLLVMALNSPRKMTQNGLCSNIL